MAKKIASVLLALLLLSGCSQGKKPSPQKPIPSQPTANTPHPTPDTAGDLTEISKEAPLMVEAETLEEAQALAELYGITLVDFNLGLATFSTGEDPQAVIRRGQENTWPELYLNRSMQLLS